MRAQFNTDALAKLAKVAPERAKKAMIRGVNDALFATRKATPDLLRAAIDRPTPFSLRPLVVEKATSQPEGTLKMQPIQGEYLGFSEFGLEKKNSIVPSRFWNSQDKFGNLMKRFNRPYWGSLVLKKTRANKPKTKRRSGSGKVNQFFIGKPNGSKIAGIWERANGNETLGLVASFSRRYKYKKKFGIGDRWRTVAEIELKKSITKRLAEENKKL